METSTTETQTSSTKLTAPISDLFKIVDVGERYKKLFPQLLEIFQDMYNSKDKTLLFEIQPIAMFVRPEKAELFKKFMSALRTHFDVIVKNANNCRQRLTALRAVFLNDEERQVINDALDLLNLPNSSEIQTDADFRLLSLQQITKELDVVIELQELFIYLNSMFQPTETLSTSKKEKSQKKR